MNAGVYVDVELEDNCSVSHWLITPYGDHIGQKKRNFHKNHKLQGLIRSYFAAVVTSIYKGVLLLFCAWKSSAVFCPEIKNCATGSTGKIEKLVLAHIRMGCWCEIKTLMATKADQPWHSLVWGLFWSDTDWRRISSSAGKRIEHLVRLL